MNARSVGSESELSHRQAARHMHAWFVLVAVLALHVLDAAGGVTIFFTAPQRGEEMAMIKLRTVARVSFILGVLSILAVVASHLALTDIRRGEPDLSLEWRALQISFLVTIAFQVSGLITLRQVLREH